MNAKTYVINSENVDELADRFELAAQPAQRPKRATFESTKTRQAVLLTGLDCLAGQADLFDGIDGAK
jgi:hypothetical protein